MKTLLLRTVPILGWLYLAYGISEAAKDRPLRGARQTVWWIDAFLSIVVHAAQIPTAVKQAETLGHSSAKTAALTMIFGLTWWKTQPTTREASA